MATSLVVRRVHLTTPGPTVIAISLAVVGVGELLALGSNADSSPWRLAPAFLVTGLANGGLNAVLSRESVASVPPDRAAMGSGANNAARYLGAACGIHAVLGADDARRPRSPLGLERRHRCRRRV